jgi:hypothetical protein
MLGQTWQFGAAAEAIDLAIGDAGDELAAMAAMDWKCWLLLRQGRLRESGKLAQRWADDCEPARLPKATEDELAAAQVSCPDGVTGEWLRAHNFRVRTPAGDLPARLQIAPIYDPQRLRIR